MIYTIEVAESAEKVLKKIPKKDRSKILEKIESLSLDPRPSGSIKLKGSAKSPLYRVRHGNYRVIYTIQDDLLFILVVDIGHRKEIYQ